MWSTAILALLLIFASLGLLAWHLQAWRAMDHGGLPEREQKFFRHQFRRRTICSGLIGALGLSMIASLWIEHPVQEAIYWFGAFLVLCVLVLLAILDYWATQAHFGRDVAVQKAEYAALQAQIRKYREEQRESSSQEGSADSA